MPEILIGNNCEWIFILAHLPVPHHHHRPSTVPLLRPEPRITRSILRRFCVAKLDPGMSNGVGTIRHRMHNLLDQKDSNTYTVCTASGECLYLRKVGYYCCNDRPGSYACDHHFENGSFPFRRLLIVLPSESEPMLNGE